MASGVHLRKSTQMPGVMACKGFTANPDSAHEFIICSACCAEMEHILCAGSEEAAPRFSLVDSAHHSRPDDVSLPAESSTALAERVARSLTTAPGVPTPRTWLECVTDAHVVAQGKESHPLAVPRRVPLVSLSHGAHPKSV